MDGDGVKRGGVGVFEDDVGTVEDGGFGYFEGNGGICGQVC